MSIRYYKVERAFSSNKSEMLSINRSYVDCRAIMANTSFATKHILGLASSRSRAMNILSFKKL